MTACSPLTGPEKTGPSDLVDPFTVEPFRFHFGRLDEQYCLSRADCLIDELPIPVTWNSQKGTLSEAVTCLSGLLAGQLDELQRIAVEDALSQIELCAHEACDCADLDWEMEQHFFSEELLAQFGSQVWGVSTSNVRSDDIVNEINLSRLWDVVRVSARYGFDEVAAVWNQHTLTITFWGYPWGSETVQAVPLSLDRLKVYETVLTWQPNYARQQGFAHVCVTESLAVLQNVADLLTSEWGDQGLEMDALVDLAKHWPDDQDVQQTVLGLIPTWDGSMKDLVSTCVSLRNAPA